MKRVLKVFTAFSLCIAGLIGCSSAPQLSEQQALQQFPTVMQLKEQLQSGQNAGLNVLAPSAFDNANKAYEQANKLAQAGDARSETVARRITSYNVCYTKLLREYQRPCLVEAGGMQ